MKLQIFSERGYQTWASWDIVYEWEDELAKRLDANIITISKTKKFLMNFFPHALHKIWKDYFPSYHWNGKSVQLSIVMNARAYYRYPLQNTIPIFLDFPEWMIEKIASATKSLPCFFVTCYCVYDRMRQVGVQNVYYIPLSIADKYATDTVPQKKIDVIQLGRKNATLHEYMLQYVKNHPTVEYIYQMPGLRYESTKRGDIGAIDTREAYIQLLQSCRVSLISTPSVDSKKRFGSVEFFTPRIYESAVLYCRMIGRYTENQEARLLGVERVCPNAKSYEVFAKQMDLALQEKEPDWTAQREFVQENLTSKRAERIREVIDSLC